MYVRMNVCTSIYANFTSSHCWQQEWQSNLPHTRQWCFRFRILKASWQLLQKSDSLSWTHRLISTIVLTTTQQRNSYIILAANAPRGKISEVIFSIYLFRTVATTLKGKSVSGRSLKIFQLFTNTPNQISGQQDRFLTRRATECVEYFKILSCS